MYTCTERPKEWKNTTDWRELSIKLRYTQLVRQTHVPKGDMLNKVHPATLEGEDGTV